MIAMAVAMGIGRFVYTLILPGMMEGAGVSAADAGMIASANYLGYLVGALLAAGGWASGRERELMLSGLAGTALLCAAMCISDSVWLFLVVRFLAGMASAFVMVFLASIVFSHLAAAGRNDLQAVHFAGVGTGIALSSIMMLVLGAEWPDWRAGWYVSAALSALGFLAAALLIDRGPLSNGAAGPEPALPKSAALAKVIVAYGLFGIGYVVTATFLITIVRSGDGGPAFEATRRPAEAPPHLRSYRFLATINPVSYLIEAIRSLFIVGWDGEALFLGFVIAGAIAVLSIAFAARSLKGRMLK